MRFSLDSRSAARKVTPSVRFTSVSGLAIAACSLALSTPGLAQVTSSGPQANSSESSAIDSAETQRAEVRSEDTIIVTGTAIVRDGYEAPTPVTVVGEDLFGQAASANIADTLNDVPALSGSLVPATTRAVSGGTNGVAGLNLRNLGLARTLVLVDGQRSVGSLVTGVVDANTIPQQLVSRVEVVTGGASAVYGSDAVAGVVNFILDKTYTGVKLDASSSITSYGDDWTYDIAMTAGLDFADGRGHLLVSGSANYKDGILNADRPWNKTGGGTIRNPNYTPTNGEPQNLIFDCCVGVNNATPGGIITSGPLRGTAFGPGGSIYQFQYGSLVSSYLMYGGDWELGTVRVTDGPSLDTKDKRQNLFGRLSYDLTENINVFAQASWAGMDSRQLATPLFYLGSFPTIQLENPLIPEPVRSQMTDLGLTTLQLGTWAFDIAGSENSAAWGADNDREVSRYIAGISGDFSLLGGEWTWNAYYQRGQSDNEVVARKVPRRSRVVLASDAVPNPEVGGVPGVPIGAAVCRSRLTDPTSTCVPFNPFGTGVNSPAAISYLLGGTGGESRLNQRLEEDVWAATISGEPFSLWAGPVSAALSFVHRTETGSGNVDEVTAQLDWFGGNYAPVIGSYSVTEGAIEVVVPLADGASWADKWDVNGAVRLTDYSTSGLVVPWKIGTTFSPIPDITLRATLSRDIRAPNLQELFATASRSGQGTVTDYFTGTTPAAYSLLGGNIDLEPEVADGLALGAVFTPTFMPGFSASLDYWSIEISDAIQNVGGQTAVDLCFQGNQTFCPYIIRNEAGVITDIRSIPSNIASQTAEGLDAEITLNIPASDLFGNVDGDFSLRFVGTRYLSNLSTSGLAGSIPNEAVGENIGNGGASAGTGTIPNWRALGSLSYRNDRITASVTARAVSAGVYDNSFITCTSNCPPSTINNQTINYNHIDGAVYFDVALARRFDLGGSDAELYLNVRNVLNKDPVVAVPFFTATWFNLQTNPALYDYLGAVIRGGVRIDF